MATQLTKHFTFEELTYTSNTRYQARNREYGKRYMHKLKTQAEFLEHVRDLLGSPLIVTSGVRCPELNKAVGGVATSQHLLCEATDVIPTKMSVPDAFQMIYESGISYDQMILEQVGTKSWLHLSNKGLLNRREALVYNGRKYVRYNGVNDGKSNRTGGKNN